MEQTIGAVFQELKQKLQSIYDNSEAEIIAKWVFEKILDIDNLQMSLYKNQILSVSQLEMLMQYETELLLHRPIQYVLGESLFYELKLKVDESVLIPRPETEELVDWCLKEINRSINQNITILDIGTGSGCIALALKSKLKNADVYGVDISADALVVAKENGEINDLSVVFVKMDILNPEIDIELPMFDIIISNPPYITTLERSKMEQNVLKYEPETALFVKNNDPLQFYKGISDFAKESLKKNGQLFFELNAKYAEETAYYLQKQNWLVTLKKDLQDRPRMIRATFE